MFIVQAIEVVQITGKDALMVGKVLEKAKRQFKKQSEKEQLDGNLEKTSTI